MFLQQIHDTAATHAVTMHVPIGVLVLRVPLDDDGMRSVAHFGTGPILSAAVDGEGVLSGNELTEAVVFGSTAGTEAAVYVSDNQ